MAYILDTHALIFFGEGDKRLSARIRSLIAEKEAFVSFATLWEISIKNSLGKLPLSGEFEDIPDFLQLNSIKTLTLEFQDLVLYQKLPLIHRDPFDRILIAQSVRTGYPVITKDPEISKYSIKTLW